jgi:MraZ protein
MFGFCSVLTGYLVGIIWFKWQKVGKSGEKMFIGQFEHAVDQKGRLAIPSRFRKALKEGAILTKGLDGCLFLFPKEKWTKIASSIGHLPETKSSARLYGRLILAGASECEFDSQGRILLPQYLRKYSSIAKFVIITGLYDRIEIWSKGSWDRYVEKNEAKAAEVVEEISSLEI